jgi:uncharacterized GH25 family protein
MVNTSNYIKKIIFVLCVILLIKAADANAQSTEQKPAAPQKMLEVTVLDKSSGDPVKGAKATVRIVQQAGGDIRKTDVTDESGHCNFPIEDKAIQFLRLEVIKEGFVPNRLSLSAAQTNEIIAAQQVVNLDKGTKIGGLVQDEDGRPIEGAVVSVSLQSTNPNDPTAITGYEIKTDANGLWFCDIIPENPDRILIRFTDPNYRTENVRVQAPSPILQILRESSHEIRLQKQLNITGQVLDRNGGPIEGALVAQGKDRRTLFYPSTKTDSEGRYSFENVTPGEMYLTVQAEGYSPDTIRFVVQKQMSPIIFRLEQGNKITGRVIDPNGNPVEGATLSADTWREFRSLTWETTTDANGRFVWNDAPKDEVTINVNKRRYIIILNFSIKPSEKEYVITLLPELVIHGTVTDANSSTPVNDFIFSAGVEGSAGENISWKSSTRITKQNNYEMRFTFPSNEYYIRVEAEGYESEVSRAITGKEGDVTVDFKLHKIAPVSCTVLSSDGKPLADTEVMVVTRQLQILNGKAGTRPSNDKLSVKTDFAGTFSFAPKTDDYSIVILNEQGYAFAKKDELAAAQNITMTNWARLEGTFKIGEKPGAKETVIYNPKSLPALTGVIFDFQTRTDDGGNFVFEKIPAGEGSVTRQLLTSGNLRLNTHVLNINAVPGQTAKVQIGGTGRPVAGKIKIPEQIKERANWQNMEGVLNIQSSDNPYILISFKVNADGSFRIEDVPGGEYLLNIQAYDSDSIVRLPGRVQVAMVTHPFSVPAMPSGKSSDVLELGEFELEITADTAAGKSLIGKTIPDFNNVSFDIPPAGTQGKPILVCLWDYWQRPSRNCIIELNKRAKELKEKNIDIVTIHITKIDEETLAQWLKDNAITLPVGTAGNSESQVRFKWAVQSLPWLVLANSDHIVITEGFGINELDEKISSLK